MAERGRTNGGASPSSPKTRKRKKKSSDDLAVGSNDVNPALTRSLQRVLELEADLAAARSTIDALLNKVESGMVASPAESAKPDLPTTGEPHADRSGELTAADESEAIGEPRESVVPWKTAGPAEAAEAAEAAGADEPEEEIDLNILLRQRTRALIAAEKQIESKSTELDNLNEMKVEFISIATHELRTPLTSIVGYLDLLEEGRFGDVPKTMERPMASLRRNAHRLKRLVDEMLDVSRIDSGRVTLFRTRCDFQAIVRDVVADLQSQAATKRQELSVTLGVPPEIFADVEKIRQIINKVVGNAIRHTPEGGVITVMLDTAPPERFAGMWARLRVRATGITIPSDMRSRIFEPFSTPHKARHHTSAGPDAAGLGLYIARGLIDLHGGLISVDSIEGSHTEFTVLLPQSEPTEQNNKQSAHAR